MRVLGSAVLGIEAIIVMLATLVAANGGTIERPALAYGAGAALMVAMLVTIGFLKRGWAVWVGWVLQVLLLAFGFVVPVMWVIGAIFAVLWWLAVRNGRRVDELRARSAS
jgi:hypothetical protein